MTVEDLKGVKLSQVTAGYLGIYIVLVELHEMADRFTSMEYGREADDINEDFYMHRNADSDRTAESL